MKRIAQIASLAAIVILSACKEDAPVQTVEWYKGHDAERAQMIAKCGNNPGERSVLPNCVNAQTAKNQLDNARRGVPQLNAAEFGKALKEGK